MYIYDLGCTGYDGSYFHQWLHETKFSQEEFEEIIQKTSIKALKYYIEGASAGKIKEDLYIPEFEDRKFRTIFFRDASFELFPTFDKIFLLVEYFLIKDYGFKPVRFQAEFHCFDGANLLEEDKEEDPASFTSRLINYVMENLSKEYKINLYKLQIKQLERDRTEGYAKREIEKLQEKIKKLGE